MGLCGWTALVPGRDTLTNTTVKAANHKSLGQGNRKVPGRKLSLLDMLGHCIITGSNIKMEPY